MYSFQSRVRFSEVDSTLHLTLPALLTYFQDCSTFHSDSLGMGVKWMKEEGLAWILSSWQIIVERYPDLSEELTISTWAYGWKGFFGYRNFQMTDADGNRVAYANTIWLYTDLNTMRPVRIPQEVCDAYSIEPQIEMENAPRKIPVPKNGTPKEPFAVRRSDIDSNHHVNNERYVLFAQEFLPEDFIVRRMRAEYKKSALYGDTMYPVVTEEPGMITVVLNNREGSPFAVIEFSQI